MLDTIDIKVIGIFGIVLILIIGYLVYVMYQDLVFVKKEVAVIKSGTFFEQEDNESWCSSEQIDELDELDEENELDDIEQDNELDRHLARFLDQQIKEQLPVIEEVEEPVMEEPEMCEVQEPVKKRSYKKKKVEFAEQQEIEE